MASERLPHGRVVSGEGAAAPHRRPDRSSLRDVSATGATRPTRKLDLPEIDPTPAPAPEAPAPAAPARPSAREGSGTGGRSKLVSHLVTALITLVLLSVIALLVMAVLAQQGAFAISAIHAADSAHLTGDDIARLASVSSDTSLLTVDTTAISDNLKRNPWVKDVHIAREFPSTLRIEVTERVPRAVVLMSSGDRAWLLSDDNHWIEPLALDTGSGSWSGRDIAYQKAQEMGCLFIENVPVSMVPASGSLENDAVLDAVWLYLAELSEEFRGTIISFSAPSENAISCTLQNGVEVSLGSPVDIAEKEAVVRAILDEHPNDVTYVNVRLPSKPTYRKVGVPSGHEADPITYSVDPTAPAQQEKSDAPAEGEGALDAVEQGQGAVDASTGSDASSAGTDERQPMFVNDETGELFYDYESYIASLS